jgi:DNA helicase-2/ATP-dependent DNA helicase PcrA
VRQARQKCVGLLRARLELPPAQLPTFVALTLNYDAAELATADKLADRAILQTSNRRSLAAMVAAIEEIVSSEQFEPVDTDNAESRYARSGQLTVMTMHKAKGLDWDCVFLPFLQEKNIPGHLWISPQLQFLGDFTLEEVARGRIRTGLWHREMSGSDGLPAIDPDPARSWETAKQLKTAEEFRLLYVAITRAKRLLWMSAARDAPFTWNKPDNLETALPCPVLPALLERFPESAPPGSTGTNRRNFRT